LLLVSVAASFFLNLGGVPLFDLDEGAFSEATREMFERGDFISTYLNGAPRYDKPILIYWLQALSVWLLGVRESAFRLPSALAATLWVAAIHGFARQLLGRTTALVAAILTATALGVTVIGKAATADALLNLWLCAALLDGFRYYRERSGGLLYRVFLWVGLGVLTKGPVAILIPGAVSFAFFAWRRELKAWLRAVFDPVGLAIAAGVALPWYLVEYWREGDAFIQGFLLKHNVERFTHPLEGHGGNIFYHLPVVLLLVLPYTSWLLVTLKRVRQARDDQLNMYLWMWFGFVLVFFSLANTKLPHYMLYGATPLFILMAQNRERLRGRFSGLLPPLLFFASLVSLPLAVRLMLPRLRDPYVRDMLQDPQQILGLGYCLVLGSAALATVLLMLERTTPVWSKLLVIGLLSVTVLNLQVMPAVAAFQQAPIKAAALVARREKGPAVLWQLNTPSFSVYRRRITERREPKAGELVLTKAYRLAELPEHRVLYRKRGIALARILGASSP
jgi:4-amino-4-deoxy-L-arabinose transferase-like glycosyltransferase